MKKIIKNTIKETVKIMTGRDVDVEIIEGVPVLSKKGEWHIYLLEDKMRFIGILQDSDLDFINTISRRRDEILKLSCIGKVGSSRPFSGKEDGLRWFVGVLESRGFTDIRETNKLCNWDLEAEYGGEKFVFELKNRTFPSSKFGDVVMSGEKYALLSSLPFRSVLVTFWPDKWCMVELHKTVPIPEDTTFDGIVVWDINDLKLMDYE